MQMLSFNKVRAHCTNVHLRSERHGDEWVQTVDLAIKVETGGGVLSKIEPDLLAFLFREWREGDDADIVTQGREGEPIVLRHPQLEYPMSWKKQFPGYRLQIEHGSREDDSALSFDDVKLDRIAITPAAGQVVVLTFRVIVDPEGVLEELASHDKCEIELTLTPPSSDAQQQLAVD